MPERRYNRLNPVWKTRCFESFAHWKESYVNGALVSGKVRPAALKSRVSLSVAGSKRRITCWCDWGSVSIYEKRLPLSIQFTSRGPERPLSTLDDCRAWSRSVNRAFCCDDAAAGSANSEAVSSAVAKRTGMGIHSLERDTGR